MNMTNNVGTAARRFPGGIRQNGYIVNSLEQAIESWRALDVGPWIKLPTMVQPMNYRGVAVEPEITIAFANCGDLQIEIVQQVNDSPSIYREFLDAGSEGFHHIAFWAEDYDAWEKSARAADMAFVNESGPGAATRFAYVEFDGATSTVVEVMELNAMTNWLMDHVRDAHYTWDGATDPIRTLG